MSIFTKQADIFKEMSIRERRAFSYHILYAISDGVTNGILALNEFVFLKSLEANKSEVAMLFMAAVILLPLSIYIPEIIKRFAGKKRLLTWTAILTRIPIFLFFIFPNEINPSFKGLYIGLYLFIFSIYYIANPVVLPLLNLFTKKIYAPSRFGRLFSYAMVITQGFWFVSTLVFGILMDKNPSVYKFVFPAMGVISLIGILYLGKIPYKEKRISINEQLIRFRHIFKEVTASTFQILKGNRPFLDFQAGMMLYGIGFLMAQPIVTLYLANEFMMKYSQIAFYKNIPLIISILTYPIFGRMMDTQDPRRMAMMSFFFAGLFYFFLLMAGFIPFTLLIFGKALILMVLMAFLSYGFFNSSIGLVWGIGSSYFARGHDAAKYQSIHLSMTGIRGCMAPFLGIAVYQLLGFKGAFTACVCFEMMAILMMKYSLKKRNLVS